MLGHPVICAPAFAFMAPRFPSHAFPKSHEQPQDLMQANHEQFAHKDGAQGKTFWTRIEATRPHKDGRGFPLKFASYERLYTTLSRRISFLLRTPWRCIPRSAEGAPLILDALPDLSMTRDGAVQRGAFYTLRVTVSLQTGEISSPIKFIPTSL